MLLWATDREAYGRLASLLTHARRSAPKGEYHLSFADIAAYADGLMAGVLLRGIRDVNEYRGKPLAAQLSFGFAGELRTTVAVPSHLRLMSETRSRSLLEQLHQYRDLFGDRCYAVAELYREQDDRRRLLQMAELAHDARVPLVAANDVHYHIPQRRPLHDVLTATRLGCTVAELGDRVFVNAERHLKSPEEMLRLFDGHSAIVERTAEVADRCTFSLTELRYDYPEELSFRCRFIVCVRKKRRGLALVS